MRDVAPTIGDRVHYRSWGSAPLPDGTQVHPAKCRPADVVEIISEAMVTLFVINPSGIFFDECTHDPALARGGTWHRPAECEAARD